MAFLAAASKPLSTRTMETFGFIQQRYQDGEKKDAGTEE